VSFNERWRRFKIVAPLTQDRSQEIIGGLKNALDRGEPLAKAKQSFLNAGYKPEEIESAVQKMPVATPQMKKPETPEIKKKNTVENPKTETKQDNKTFKTTTEIPGQKKHLSKKFLIILISSSILVLVGAALLGIFWDKIF
jgi:hypothetical protein